MQMVISQMTEANMAIIGLVATALRHLSAVYPEKFRSLIPTIPLPFLLSVPKSTEVIDFLQQSAFNFDSFAAALLSTGQKLAVAVGNWIQKDEPHACATLELLATLARLLTFRA